MTSLTPPTRRQDRLLLSLCLMLITAASFSGMSVLVKSLGQTLPAYVVAFYRGLINALVVLLLLAQRRQLNTLKGAPAVRPVLISRGVAGTTSLLLSFYSLTLLPLAVATLLNWLSPLFTCLLSHLFLGERISARQLRSIGIAFSGLILLLAPGLMLGSLSLVGSLLGLLGAFCAGIAQTSIRSAAAKSSAEVIVFYFVGITTVVLIIPAIGHAAHSPAAYLTETAVIVPVLLLGLAGSAGQIAMTNAYRFAPASRVSVMGLLTPAFSVLFGYLLFGEALAPMQWAGVAAVCAGVLGVARKGESASETTDEPEPSASRLAA